MQVSSFQNGNFAHIDEGVGLGTSWSVTNGLFFYMLTKNMNDGSIMESNVKTFPISLFKLFYKKCVMI